MAKKPTMPPTELTVPQPNPFNLQATKRYIFNETGNIMLASTEIGSEEIQQSVRDVFNEVSVFFAAMTRAMSTTIDKKTNQPYSIYDYEAIEGIVKGSGLFVQVSEEDINHTMTSWGVTVSKELIEGLLGLATGEGELAFAEGLISSIGKRGLQVGYTGSKADGRVGTIVFVCEYLMGMPIVSAIVAYVDSKEDHHTFKLGPCIKEQDSHLQLKMHKDTYMFVTPNFIREYAGDLLSVESDVKYLELVDFLQDLVEHKPTVTALETIDGKAATGELEIGTNYYITGAFLVPQGATPADITIEYVGGQSSAISKPGNPQASVVSFTPTAQTTKPAPIGIYCKGVLVAETPGSYIATGVAPSVTPKSLTSTAGGLVTITLSGGGFGTTPSAVSWGSKSITPSASDWTDTHIKVTVPTAPHPWPAGTHAFTFTAGGQTYTTEDFQLT